MVDRFPSSCGYMFRNCYTDLGVSGSFTWYVNFNLEKDFSFIPSGTSNLKYTCVRNRFVTFDVIDVSFVITYYLSEINFILPSYSFYTTLIILKTKIIPVVLFI